MATSTPPPAEVLQLLARFDHKKQHVKHRLNDIVDDLFGDFVAELTGLVTKFHSNHKTCCNLQQSSQSVDNSSSEDEHKVEEHELPFHPKYHPHHRHQSPTNYHQTIEANAGILLRNVQARAKDLINDELYDSGDLSRLINGKSQNASLLLNQRLNRSQQQEEEDIEPDITLTPIDPIVEPTTVVSNNHPVPTPNDDDEDQQSQQSQQQQQPMQDQDQDGDDEEEYDEENECKCSDCLNGVNSAENHQNGHHAHQPKQQSASPKSISETHETPHNDPEDLMMEVDENQNGNIFADITDKSLDELNNLCSELPYSKSTGKYICHFQDCGQELKSRHNLLLHQRAHLGIRPYRCKWEGCTYNSNQSSAVIRHIRTKHFNLPLTMREQAMKNIEDDRDPKAYLEVVCLDGVQPEAGDAANGSMSESIETKEEPKEESQMEPTSPPKPNMPMRAKSSLIVPPIIKPQQIKTEPHQPYSNGTRMPNMPFKAEQYSEDEEEEDDEEDEYEDSDSDPAPRFPNAANPASKFYFMQQQRMPMTANPQFNKNLALDFARKRRLESRIFANPENQNRYPPAMQPKYAFNGPLKPQQQTKRAKYSPSLLSPNAQMLQNRRPSAQNGQSQQQQRSSNGYLFCTEPECPGIFRTQTELERHLADVHNNFSNNVNTNGNGRISMQQLQNMASSSSSASESNEQSTYSSLYICQWPKCNFSTVLSSSAVNHVRGIHFKQPRTLKQLTPQQQASIKMDQRNPRDYIKMLPLVK